ncbi:hypothetical protein IM538_21670 [Cytobacillus suaedae]|nr:hypothetical protein IM538_21670 [Cytobacillus suaedae]
MKKVLLSFITVMFLVISGISQVSAADQCEGINENTAIWWGKLKLRDGQIGKVTITKPITLWSRENGKLVASRTLQPGEEYSVYRYDNQFGSQYGLGANLWLTKMPTHLIYETPSKKKLQQLECKKIAQRSSESPVAPKPMTEQELRDELYTTIANAIKNYKTSIIVPELAVRIFDRAKFDEQFSKNFSIVSSTLEKVVAENPDIFYYDGSEYSSSGLIKFNYVYSVDEIKEKKKKIDLQVESIMNSIPEDLSDYEKIKRFYEYVVKSSEYDYLNYLGNSIPHESYTIYGILIENMAVCDGYAKTMQLLLKQIGIETKYVTGTADGGEHAWIMVNLDNQWYHLDATWDDPVPNLKDRVLYEYFLVSDLKMDQYHVWDKTKFPAAQTSYQFK